MQAISTLQSSSLSALSSPPSASSFHLYGNSAAAAAASLSLHPFVGNLYGGSSACNNSSVSTRDVKPNILFSDDLTQTYSAIPSGMPPSSMTAAAAAAASSSYLFSATSSSHYSSAFSVNIGSNNGGGSGNVANDPFWPSFSSQVSYGGAAGGGSSYSSWPKAEPCGTRPLAPTGGSSFCGPLATASDSWSGYSHQGTLQVPQPFQWPIRSSAGKHVLS